MYFVNSFTESFIGPKKVVLFAAIDRVKDFCHSPARIVECVSEYIFLISKNKRKSKKKSKKKNKNTKKARETKGEKRISPENRLRK